MQTSQNTQQTIAQCAELLIALRLTLGFAESATCGHIASAFSLAPNAGGFLKGAIACYDATIKEGLLNVAPDLIKRHTPESVEVTQAIAQGIGPLLQADINIGCTGLTCPGGSETKEKPVGTMFLYGLKNDLEIFSERTLFSGDKQEIIAKTTNRVAQLLLHYLKRLIAIEQEQQAFQRASQNNSNEWSVSWP